jgi:hypothetical protein
VADYPEIRVPLELKQEVDSKGRSLQKPATDTALFRMLINTLILDDSEWTTSQEIFNKHKNLVLACQGIIYCSLNYC